MMGFYNGKTLNPTDFESKEKTASEKNQNVIVCQ